MILFSQLVQIINGTIKKISKDLPIETLLIDSRKIIATPNSVFFAIKGDRHDGHQYIGEIYRSGVRQYIVEKYLPEFDAFLDANFIVVDNSIAALQQLAQYKRFLFQIPVIAITGSNAKTIVKEWLTQLLSIQFNIVKSPKSYNSKIGVPLSVWQMNERHTLGIFEAGISKVNEMPFLQRVLNPTFGIFTNIGTAHDEGFTSRTEKIQEKLKLFKDAELVFYCFDHLEIRNEIEKFQLNTFTWGFNAGANIEIKPIEVNNEKSTFLLKCKFESSILEFNLVLPFIDSASIENIFHCIAVMIFLRIPENIIQGQINLLKKVNMRLELKKGINDTYIIDDSYNNDLAGLTLALDFLKQQNQKVKKSIILSDLFETGLEEEKLYQSIGELLVEKGVSKLIAIGSQIHANQKAFNKIESQFYPTTHDFLKNNQPNHFSNEVILVKGSRVFEFEKIVFQLQEKSHRTVLEINLDALTYNLNFYRSKLLPETKVMVMVKSFAYGSGSLEVAQLLQFQRVDYLAVAYVDEGVFLRENGIHIPIMVMNPTEESYQPLIQFNLEPVVYSISELNSLKEYLIKNEKEVTVHIEIETGMNRLGIDETEVQLVCDIIQNSKRISIASVFSHLAGADNEEFSAFSIDQFNKLNKIISLIEEKLNQKVIKHILNSAGIVRFPDFQLDMVRLGIGLYGLESNGIMQNELQIVSTLKTTISQIKPVKEQHTIGYSRVGKVYKDSKIAIIAIGYGDGYRREFSNGKGKVFINGKLAPVIGNVCMDMTMVDISEIPEAKEGDSVEIFGGNLLITEIASLARTIPYEILTGISNRVKRVFYSE